MSVGGKGQRGRGKRNVFLLLLLLFPLPSLGQAPDIRARLDLALTLDARDGGDESARLYTPLGRPSTVGLTLLLESGLSVNVSERLQRLPKDSSADLFDEAYIEDPGLYRVGKQYLPFGTGRLIRESVVAVRIDSSLIAENLPVTLAFCNEGAGRQNGAFVRVGRGVGVSVAYGEHFGISATDLGVVRHPEDAPGRGGGWRQVVGFDASRRAGKLSLSGEFLALAGGPARGLSVIDFEGSFAADAYHSVGLGYSHTVGDVKDFVRLFGRVHASRNIDAEPLVRFRGDRLFDLGVTLRLRL